MIEELSRTSLCYADWVRVCRYVGSRKQHDVVQDVTANFGDTVHIRVIHLLPRFQRRHIEQEEEHLRERLETMMYDIDAVDTVTLIKGQKGFEKV